MQPWLSNIGSIACCVYRLICHFPYFACSSEIISNLVAFYWQIATKIGDIWILNGSNNTNAYCYQFRPWQLTRLVVTRRDLDFIATPAITDIFICISKANTKRCVLLYRWNSSIANPRLLFQWLLKPSLCNERPWKTEPENGFPVHHFCLRSFGHLERCALAFHATSRREKAFVLYSCVRAVFQYYRTDFCFKTIVK